MKREREGIGEEKWLRKECSNNQRLEKRQIEIDKATFVSVHWVGL